MTPLQERVKRRVHDLRQSPITLAKTVGLERGFINDIIIGRKKSVREGKIELVAQALECDVAWLMGFQDIPQLNPPPNQILPPPRIRTLVAGPGLPVRGVCQTGIWRSRTSPPDYPSTYPVAADIRYSHIPQHAYLVRPTDERMMKVALAVDLAAFEQGIRQIDDGTIVVVQRERAELTETSLRCVIQFPQRVLAPLRGDPAGDGEIIANDSGWPADLKIVAVVTALIDLSV